MFETSQTFLKRFKIRRCHSKCLLFAWNSNCCQMERFVKIVKYKYERKKIGYYHIQNAHTKLKSLSVKQSVYLVLLQVDLAN